jgi:hypothetical protein
MLRQTRGRLQMPTDFWLENVMDEDPFEIQDVDGILTSKQILKIMLKEFKHD